MLSSFLRPMPTNPWPPERMRRPLNSPVVEGQADLVGRLPVAAPHVVHRRVGEDDAPAEGVVGFVSLDHPHAVRRVELLHQQAEVEPRGAAADADDVHEVNLDFNT
jgi:hypothetical protein